MVFQSYALYPHMTVAENIGFHLKVKKMKQEGARGRGSRRRPGSSTSHELLDRKPAKLSGGQRQRVAMGRAIVREPQVFLMDEPLSNLDAKLRVQTRTQIAALQRELGVTTVYVTHDQTEAMTMGDRVAVMNDGILQQCASPRELFTNPVNEFVAGFIGSPAMNLLPSTTDGSGRRPTARCRVPLTPEQLEALTSAAVTVGVRPNDFDIRADGGLNATVEFVEELGSEAFLYCIADGTEKEIVARTDGLSPLGERRQGEPGAAARQAPPVRHEVRRSAPRLNAGLLGRLALVRLAPASVDSPSIGWSPVDSSATATSPDGWCGDGPSPANMASSNARCSSRPVTGSGIGWRRIQASTTAPPTIAISETHWFQRRPRISSARSMRRPSTQNRPIP